ncbi:hypothetical protein Hypma_011274 [Hypsizygus marmoreus]|uniref:Uncharacterized protein n=1 Tax=Hypsizygus marmoreus TaxID=39966 RepID=A0A369JM84_HYPMA|nr:hypothetical protein Hypma_011274 [Hypsizygus marmoreus]
MTFPFSCTQFIVTVQSTVAHPLLSFSSVPPMTARAPPSHLRRLSNICMSPLILDLSLALASPDHATIFTSVAKSDASPLPFLSTLLNPHMPIYVAHIASLVDIRCPRGETTSDGNVERGLETTTESDSPRTRFPTLPSAFVTSTIPLPVTYVSSAPMLLCDGAHNGASRLQQAHIRACGEHYRCHGEDEDLMREEDWQKSGREMKNGGRALRSFRPVPSPSFPHFVDPRPDSNNTTTPLQMRGTRSLHPFNLILPRTAPNSRCLSPAGRTDVRNAERRKGNGTAAW